MLAEGPQSTPCELPIARIDIAGASPSQGALVPHRIDPGDEPVVDMKYIEHNHCMLCTKGPAPGRRLRKCKGCMSAQYCDAECQKADWPEHKAVCRSRNHSGPVNALGMPASTERDALFVWASVHKWALERFACISVHRAGGAAQFLREKNAFMITVELTDPKELPTIEGRRRIYVPHLFRPTQHTIACANLFPGGGALLETLHERGRAGGIGARRAGVLPVMCRVGENQFMTTFHPLCRFRAPESAATVAILEDMENLCLSALVKGIWLDTRKPGDAVAYPFCGGRRDGSARPLFLNWATDAEKHGLTASMGKARLGVEELMRAYAALCY